MPGNWWLLLRAEAQAHKKNPSNTDGFESETQELDQLLQLSEAMKRTMQSFLHPVGRGDLHPLPAAAQQAAAHLPQGSKLFSHPLPGTRASRELCLGTFLAVFPKEPSRTLAGVRVIVNLAGPPVQTGLRVTG